MKTPLADSSDYSGTMTVATSPSEPILAAPRTPGSRVSRAEIDDTVQGWSADLLSSGRIVGMTVAVRWGQESPILCAVGFSDRERGMPASAETVYRVGSLTKELAAAAVLCLCDDGVLTLDDPLVSWLPELSAWGQRPTVGQLLAHTAGVPAMLPALAPLVARVRSPDDEARVLDALARAQPGRPPGEGWHYSNPGYLLIGHLVARASGMDLHDYLSAELFHPLGVASVGESDRLVGHPAAAVGYDWSATSSNTVAAEYVNLATVGASGAWSASAVDLVAWDDAMDEGRALSPSSRAAQRTPACLTDGSMTEYGLGVYLGTLGPFAEVLHRGDIPGGAAFKATYPEVGVSVVVLANTPGAPVSRLGRRIARRILSVPEPAFARVALPVSELRQFAGEYRDGRVSVLLLPTDGGLSARTPDGTMLLRPAVVDESRGRFTTATDPDLIITIDVAGDGAARFHVRGPAVCFEGVRAVPDFGHGRSSVVAGGGGTEPKHSSPSHQGTP